MSGKSFYHSAIYFFCFVVTYTGGRKSISGVAQGSKSQLILIILRPCSLPNLLTIKMHSQVLVSFFTDEKAVESIDFIQS
jgi:hypothetical protein